MQEVYGRQLVLDGCAVVHQEMLVYQLMIWYIRIKKTRLWLQKQRKQRKIIFLNFFVNLQQLYIKSSFLEDMLMRVFWTEVC